MIIARTFFLVTLLVALSTQVFARSIVEKEFYVLDPEQRYISLFKMVGEFTIDHVSESGYELYGPKGTGEWLRNNNIPHYEIDNQKALLEDIFADYPNHNQMTQKLKDLVAKFPAIASLHSVGTSTNGRELWVVKISDNVEVDEIEPEVKYISTMHGDEVTGRESMVMLIEDLLTGYQVDPKITQLINNTEIFIMPNMNPDGTANRRRGNGKNIDLNRDFPDFTTADNQNNWQGRAIETQAIMKWQAGRQFALSANFHGGAVVINYPWDTKYELHPLDGLVRGLSLEYASMVPEMRDSRSFENGVTNGAAWYSINGGMQDWSYFWHGDLQITVELSQIKWPNYSLMANYYRENKESLLTYLSRVHQGAGFYFLETGVEGSVEIFKDSISLGVFGFSKSEFFKVLDDGNYRFEIVTSTGQRTVLETVVDSAINENGNFTAI